MTVSELIEILNTMPKDATVIRDDNCGGMEAVNGVRKEKATKIGTREPTESVCIGEKE